MSEFLSYERFIELSDMFFRPPAILPPSVVRDFNELVEQMVKPDKKTQRLIDAANRALEMTYAIH